ncbi:hypothetical protein HAX54_044792, partial [Datura stramonium]|nr:hypothetical protein [Datura stramonium]
LKLDRLVGTRTKLARQAWHRLDGQRLAHGIPLEGQRLAHGITPNSCCIALKDLYLAPLVALAWQCTTLLAVLVWPV